MGLAVVTGAAGSLGGAIAARLARDGHQLLLADVTDSVEDLAARLRSEGSDAIACVADLGTSRGAAHVADALWGSRVNVLVNNAGINRDARADRMTEEAFREVIRVDLVGPARLCTALEASFADGASVVNVSSRAALGNFGQANYVTAKSGLIGLTRSLAIQWAPRVRVNTIAPGLIDTPMTNGMPPQVLEKLVARTPFGRMGGPDEVAAVVGFLAGRESSYLTGQFIPVCGGRSIA